MADPLPPGVRVERNIKYGPNGAANEMDLYLPKDMNAKTPVIVWIHGGGWMKGSREPWPPLALIDKGYAVASIDYRLSGDKIFPAQIQDSKAAVRWLRENAGKYNLDPDRIGSWGSSAGGHLSALLAVTGDVKELEGPNPKGTSSAVQAAFDWCGPVDLESYSKYWCTEPDLSGNAPKQMVTQLLGGPVEKRKDLAKSASPITYASSSSAPLLIMHGKTDRTVPFAQSEMLEKALKAKGADVELRPLTGVPHGVQHMKDYLPDVEAFFDKKLTGMDTKKRVLSTDEAKPVAKYRMVVDKVETDVVLYSNGRIKSPDGANRWDLNGNTLTITGYNKDAPGGAWINTLELSETGGSFKGRNQNGSVIRGTRLEGGDLRVLAERATGGDMIPADMKAPATAGLPVDQAISRATGGAWTSVKEGVAIPISGVSVGLRKDAARQFRALAEKELGTSEGLSFTENSIVMSDALAKKMVARYETLREKDEKSGGKTTLAVDFIKAFSSGKGPLTQTNFERARDDANALAAMAQPVPEVARDDQTIKLVFKEQAQADRFAELIKESAKRAKITSVMVGGQAGTRTVELRNIDLNSLSTEQRKLLLEKAAEVIKEERNKGKGAGPDKVGMNAPDDFLGRLVATVDRIEKDMGNPAATVAPPKPESGLLASPRLVQQPVSGPEGGVKI